MVAVVAAEASWLNEGRVVPNCAMLRRANLADPLITSSGELTYFLAVSPLTSFTIAKITSRSWVYIYIYKNEHVHAAQHIRIRISLTDSMNVYTVCVSEFNFTNIQTYRFVMISIFIYVSHR